ncbi:MAG: hypothetical protein ACPG5B_07560 [Chitinophagales bacterium]
MLIFTRKATKIILFFLLVLAFCTKTYAVIHEVGASQTYASPNALYNADVVEDGDTIEIQGGTYSGQAALAVWHESDLLIRGVNGKPHLQANGQYIWGKGIWVLRGYDTTVENIEFSGATVPDRNGAGIRLDGTHLTVRNCYFHDNENGILTTETESNLYLGNILIEFSEFGHNGYGDGYSHNLYIGRVNKLTFRFNYTHHAKIGHALKSRATYNDILYNRIMDEDTGYASRLIDLPNGGVSLVMGNLVMQGTEATNKNVLGYGLEGLTNPAEHELYVINNTFVNKRVFSCTFLDIHENTSVVKLSNNIFGGTGTLINGPTPTMNTNLIETNLNNLNFVDEANYNYDLTANSPAIDAGTTPNNATLIPTFSYQHPLGYETRATVNNVMDIGAFEYGTIAAITAYLKVFLEGPYISNQQMSTNLNDNNLLPTEHNFDRTPWNYNGNETVLNANSIPANAVDWLLIELRSANNIDNVVAQRAVFLLQDGNVADTNGNLGVHFNNLASADYYVVVRSRNHLATISANAVSLPNNVNNPLDFSNPNNVLGSNTQLKDMGNGVFAQIAGDINANGVMTVGDFNIYQEQAAQLNQYLDADLNFDGTVSVADFNLYLLNNSKMAVPEVRY